MGKYDFVQANNKVFEIEDFIEQYEKCKVELSKSEDNCYTFLTELDDKKDEMKKDFYNRELLMCQKRLVDCHHQLLVIEKNILALNSMATEKDVKKTSKYKRALKKERKKIDEVSSAVNLLCENCAIDKINNDDAN